MTSQPTRRRRRLPTSSSLQQQPGTAGQPTPATASRATRRATHMREHHVTTDYSYVKKDLLLVLGVTAVTTAFIVIMSFLV